MIKTDVAVKAVEALHDGEGWTYPESDYGKAEIWLKNGTYFLFGIPEYGGQPHYVTKTNYKNNIDDLIRMIELWT
jgi:hypothetical protein